MMVYLYIACGMLGTSIDTITRLIEMWPESLPVHNKDGYLPSDKACLKNAHNADLIALLIKKWPQAVRSKCPETRELSLHLACCQAPIAQASSLAMLRLLVEAWPDLILE